VTVSIVLADDHKMFRDGLRPRLEAERDFEVVGEAEDGARLLELVAELEPDVVILDISMPVLNGVDAARRILADDGAPRVVVLSMHSDRRYVMSMLKAGASAYLLKDSSFEELVSVVRDAMRGEVRLSRQITDTVIHDYIRMARGDGDPADPLTLREREVLQRLAEGASTKEMAADMAVSIKTVESHRRQIMDKLDLHSVAELTKYAIRTGLTSLD